MEKPLIEFLEQLEGYEQTTQDHFPSLTDDHWNYWKSATDKVIFEVKRQDGWKMLVITAKGELFSIFLNQMMGIHFIAPLLPEVFS